jgi:NAD(P)-dependent dehydrogenase (short-subunit alcohol dehydrogenase family)
MNTNVRGIFNFLREALAPGYLEPSSSIVNVSSLYGLKGAPQSGPYCASKHAIIGLTRAAAREAGPSGNIRVNAVCPYVSLKPSALFVSANLTNYRQRCGIYATDADHCREIRRQPGS